jgi:hypothetical protein
MTKVVTAPSTSLDGLIAGADDSPEQRLGVDGDRLFSWFSDGDTPSRVLPLVQDVSRQRGLLRRRGRPAERGHRGAPHLRHL